MNENDAKLRILVVDDEPAARFGICDYLETQGFDVDEAANCRGALEAFQRHSPDALILDYKLPDGDGLELMARLKAIGSSVPVLVLTAHASIDLAVRAIKGGAAQFLTKPIDLPALLVLIQQEIRNTHRHPSG